MMEEFKRKVDLAVEVIESCFDENNPNDNLSFDERLQRKIDGCDDEVVESIAAIVKEKVNPKELHVTRAGATVSVHCGRNTLGVLFIQKTDVE